MEKHLMKTHDLGRDWYANQWSDGSMTLRNTEKGQRIDLTSESVAVLKAICRDPFSHTADAAEAEEHNRQMEG